jgi:hypothetical protein
MLTHTAIRAITYLHAVAHRGGVRWQGGSGHCHWVAIESINPANYRAVPVIGAIDQALQRV